MMASHTSPRRRPKSRVRPRLIPSITPIPLRRQPLVLPVRVRQPLCRPSRPADGSLEPRVDPRVARVDLRVNPGPGVPEDRQGEEKGLERDETEEDVQGLRISKRLLGIQGL